MLQKPISIFKDHFDHGASKEPKNPFPEWTCGLSRHHYPSELILCAKLCDFTFSDNCMHSWFKLSMTDCHDIEYNPLAFDLQRNSLKLFLPMLYDTCQLKLHSIHNSYKYVWQECVWILPSMMQICSFWHCSPFYPLSFAHHPNGFTCYPLCMEKLCRHSTYRTGQLYLIESFRDFYQGELVEMCMRFVFLVNQLLCSSAS